MTIAWSVNYSSDAPKYGKNWLLPNLCEIFFFSFVQTEVVIEGFHDNRTFLVLSIEYVSFTICLIFFSHSFSCMMRWDSVEEELGQITKDSRISFQLSRNVCFLTCTCFLCSQQVNYNSLFHFVVVGISVCKAEMCKDTRKVAQQNTSSNRKKWR